MPPKKGTKKESKKPEAAPADTNQEETKGEVSAPQGTTETAQTTAPANTV